MSPTSSYEQQEAESFKRNFRRGLYGVGAVMGLVMLLFAWPFAQVGAGERGVVLHFGKVQAEILDEGMHLVAPFLTSVKKISVQIQKSDVQTESSSKDLQQIHTDVVINWSLPPTKVNTIYQTLGDEKAVLNNIIAPAINEVFKAASAKKTAEEIISKRIELTNDVETMLKERLAKYDLTVRDISLVDVKFSPEFNKAIEEKQVAEQEAKKFIYVAQKAEQQAVAQVNTARGARDAKIVAAEGNKRSEIIEAEGKAQAQKLLESSLSPQILQKIALDKWDGSFPQVMSGGSGALPFLNLNPSGLGAKKSTAPASAQEK